MNDAIAAKFENEKIEYKRDFELASSSSFKIGGYCAMAVFPRSAAELVSALRTLDGAGICTEIIGRGSNLLFADGKIDAALVFTGRINSFEINGVDLRADCGASLAALSHTCADRGLSGLEFACGIPGSVGGAVYMNAGAYGGAISDMLVSSVAYDRKRGELTEVTDHNFDYRHSVYMDSPELICLQACFKLTEGDVDAIKARNSELLDQRRQKQPLNFPSAGSYFKRPEGYFAAKLIDDLGLKGTRVGDAAVSEKHAGFIVNLGCATFDDVMRLEEIIKSAVLKEFGIELCREVRIIK